MTKAKGKHENKGATGATRCNVLNLNGDLLHPAIFNKGATRVQQGATKMKFLGMQQVKMLLDRDLSKCCMLYP